MYQRKKFIVKSPLNPKCKKLLFQAIELIFLVLIYSENSKYN